MKHGLTAFQTKGCRCEVCKTTAVKSTQKFKAAAQQRFKQDPTSLKKHGIYGYGIGCRCDVCTKSSKEQKKKSVAKHIEHFKETGTFKSTKVKHGSSVAYKYGCRCDLCKQWKTNQRLRLIGAQT